MKILLIPGHGAGDPGAVATHGNKTYQEQAEARTLAFALKEALDGYAAVTVYPTTRCAYTDYKTGVLNDVANFTAYDYVLELHFNAYQKDGGDGKVKGSEAFVTTGEKGVTVEENILKKLAALGFTNRGVKRKNWSVIAQAKEKGVSSCLLETCFIDDKDDMALYESNRAAVARSIAAGIISGFALQRKTMTPQEAIGILVTKGVIQSPEYWVNRLEEVKYLGELLINMANKLR